MKSLKPHFHVLCLVIAGLFASGQATAADVCHARTITSCAEIGLIGTGNVDDNVTVNGRSLCVDGRVEGNVAVYVTTHGVVEGNIIEHDDGQVEVQGAVYGNVEEYGPGSVEINGGEINGNLIETDNGHLFVKNGSYIDGNIEEYGNGSTAVDSSSQVEGDIIEAGQPDTAPVAHAGADQRAGAGETVILDGSAPAMPMATVSVLTGRC